MPVFAELLLELAEGAFAVDAQRQVILWNPACEDLFGIPAREALGRPCHEVVQACDRSGRRFCRPDCGVAQLVRGGAAPRPEPIWVSRNEGLRRALWLSVYLMPSQWKDLWTVVHLLQREAPVAMSLGQGPPAVERTHCGSARNAAQRSDSSVPQMPSLTAREREILRLLAQGLPASAISRRLFISAVTVRNHIQHLIRKLGLHSQIEAVAYAYRNNLVASAQHEFAPRMAAEGAR